jgi:type I restriction enzyme S subunit
LKRFPVDLPPLDEQKKIAEILGSVDEAIQATQAVIDQTRKVKQGLLQQLLTRGIGHTRFKQTEIGEIPESWEVMKCGDLAKVVDCPHSTPQYSEAGYPIVRTPDVKEGWLNLESCLYVDREQFIERTRRATPESGDILLTREAPVGEACLIPIGVELCLGQRMVLLKPRSDRVLSGYLLSLFYSPSVRSKMGLLGGGSTVHHLNVKDIRDLPLPIPDLAEQESAARILSSQDQLLADYTRTLLSWLRLKRGLMQDLLTGRVRVSNFKI